MKKMIVQTIAGIIMVMMSIGVAFAGNGAPSGKHWNVNFIGHPKNVDAIGGDHSNGRAIMIPLKNASGGKNAQTGELVCDADAPDQTVFTNDEAPSWADQVVGNARIHFLPGDRFEILDRDATDGSATIMIPTRVCAADDPDPMCQNGINVDDGDAETNPEDRVIAVEVWMRVLGKPSMCMDIDGYAYDLDQSLYFWSGRVDLNRKHGKSSFKNIDDMFNVWFCQVDFDDLDGDTVTDECVDGTDAELSVFDNVFEEYFWNMQNNGVRIVQMRLYPVTR